MDSDEFDDDILDEDLIAAVTQASSHIDRLPPTGVVNGFNSQQRVGDEDLAHNRSTAIELDLIDSCFLGCNRFGKHQYCLFH